MKRKMQQAICIALLGLFTLSCSKQESKPLVINPQPQSLVIDKPNTISIASGIKAVSVDEKLADAINFAKANTNDALPLNISYGATASQEHHVHQIDGAYYLQINEQGINIVGYNERGAYYGIKTLEQILENSQNNKIDALTIVDFPDIPYRGVVEGFYGTPWSHEVRKSLINYYGRYKMNSYLYGPKDDPYHSSPHWRDPYPAAEAAKLKELVDISNKNHLDFIWAIHPGLDIDWSENDYSKLLAKFESMYDLGVRSFAMFFDDISGIGTSAVKQAEWLNRIHKDFVLTKGDVKPLIMCPTDYTELWADPKEDGYLSILGDNLDPSIHVMWTGEAICCDITDRTLNWVNSRINRPTFIWWNYPVTDYVKHIILQGPVYGNSQEVTKNEMAGFVSNPMEHGEASKIGLYGVANYTWNIKGHKPIENWDNAIKSIMPEAAEAYRTFAIHSTDTETGYRRDESWETTTFPYDTYTDTEYKNLKAEFERIKTAPSTIISKSTNKLLVKELTPWLIEFEKLGNRGLNALELIKHNKEKDHTKLWDTYRAGIMTSKELADYKAHRSGTLKLTPFINNVRKHIALDLYAELSGKAQYEIKPISNFKNISTEVSSLMLDGNSATHYTSAQGQKEGDWVGLDMGTVIPVKYIYIEQGRNNIDDVDYFDHAKLEVSKDGKEWTTILDKLVGKYIIEWKGDAVDARYIKLSRLNSKRKNWFTVRRFEINAKSSNPQWISDIPQLQGRAIDINNTTISVAPVLEVISIKPNQSFVLELPYLDMANYNIDLGSNDIKVEFSSNGKDWQPTLKTFSFIRYKNKTKSNVDINFNKFEVTMQAPDAAQERAMDKNLETAFKSSTVTNFTVPSNSNEFILLSNKVEGGSQTILQLDADNKELSTTEITNTITELQLDPKSNKIQIKGKVDIYEVIFK